MVSLALKMAAVGLSVLQGAAAAPVYAGPNTLAQYNPTIRSMSDNATWMVVPLDAATIAAIVAPKKLVPITSDTSKYPSGWPAGKHPLVLSFAYSAYIEQLGLEIPEFLMSASAIIPCVDVLGDGKTCISQNLNNYIGGANGQLLSPEVPALVGSLEGTNISPGVFIPDDSPISDIGGGQYTAQVDHEEVPNPASGPGLAPQVFSITYSKTAQGSLLTSKGFHFLINQPLLLNNGLCSNGPYYFNETFARPFFGEGTTTLYNYAEDINPLPASIAGTYPGSVYSGNAETVGYNPQTCQAAAADFDPTTQQ